MNRFAAMVLLGAAVAVPSWAQGRPDTLLSVERYLDLEQVSDPQISPDGKTVVYSRSHVDKVNDRWESDSSCAPSGPTSTTRALPSSRPR